eukprot:521905_1
MARLVQELDSLKAQESEQCNVNASALAQKEVELEEVNGRLQLLQNENTTLKEGAGSGGAQSGELAQKATELAASETRVRVLQTEIARLKELNH